MDILIWIILATLVDGLTGLVGVFSLWINEKFFKKLLFILVAFSAGALLSGAFFHLLAESLSSLPVMQVFAFMMVGFTAFFLIERFLHWHHCHDGEKCEVHPVSYLILIGDAIHNFIDGVIIGASFLVNVHFGIITTLLILAHEIPQELGNFGVLVYGGFGKNKALLYNFLSQLTCILGGIAGYLLSASIQGIIPFILPFAAGGFIYIGASDLVPELHKEPKLNKLLVSFGFFILGMVFIFLIKYLFE
jgi:zinc and cadmium transporter